jgi:hypothetical protein
VALEKVAGSSPLDLKFHALLTGGASEMELALV